MKKPGCVPGAAPRLLTATEASQTLVARLGPTVNRLRQRLTNFGLRPYEVYLVWTRWTGPERGEGSEVILKRVPILPSPKVEDLTSVSLQFYSGGTLPVGSVRVTEIPPTMAQDTLSGLTVPADPAASFASQAAGRGPVDPSKASLAAGEVVDPYEFFWEIVDDGRSNEGRLPVRRRFRPLSKPFRRAEQFDWAIVLERVSEDMKPNGQPQTAPATVHEGVICDPDD